jgi:hypothetical protein
MITVTLQWMVKDLGLGIMEGIRRKIKEGHHRLMTMDDNQQIALDHLEEVIPHKCLLSRDILNQDGGHHRVETMDLLSRMVTEILGMTIGEAMDGVQFHRGGMNLDLLEEV